MAQIELTKAHQSQTVHASPGDVLVIRLPENPTTGYRWALDQPLGDLLIEAGSNLESAPGSGVGGGGERRLSFRVDKPGVVTLRLTLRREWEGAASGLDSYSATIQIGH